MNDEKTIRVRVRQSIASAEGWMFSPGCYDIPATIAKRLLRNQETAVLAKDGEAVGPDNPCPHCGRATFGPPGARRCSACGRWVPPTVTS